MKQHPRLFSAAGRQFGSWGKALLAAGIEIPKYTHSPHGLIGVLQTLRDALDSGSKNDVPGPLKSCAVYYFGSLEKALAATIGKAVGVSAKTKIKTVLCRMHTARQSLVYGQTRWSNRALVRAAEKHFGSWGKALHAAGVDLAWIAIRAANVTTLKYRRYGVLSSSVR
jgi:hypothetical protein